MKNNIFNHISSKLGLMSGLLVYLITLPLRVVGLMILKFLIISTLSFSSLYSFSQPKPAFEIYDSTKVCDGYILLMFDRKCSVMDRKGKVLFNIPGNLVSFFNNKQEMATHNDDKLVVYNKDMDVLRKIDAIVEHELITTPENNIMFFSEECDSINNMKIHFANIICIDSSMKKTVKWSSFEQRRYLMDFIMKDTSIFRYKIKGSSDPDSVLFQIAPSLGRVWLIPIQLKDDPIADSIKWVKSRVMKNNFPEDSVFTSGKTRELFHMNSIQIIPANKSEEKDSVFKKGNILLSFCNFDDSIRSFIAIVDPVKYKILWYYIQEDGRGMHTPLMLPNGHILLYVNWSKNIPFSCINEIDPITKKVEWDYIENFRGDWMRNMMGSCQRLPNGNTFISNRNGLVYEVTPDKKIVWQWSSFDKTTKQPPMFIYRALLIPKEKLNWLEINE